MNGLKVITLYIAAWGWHILGIQFLIMGIIAGILAYIPIAIAGFILLMVCEFMAIKRKAEISYEEIIDDE